MLGHIRQLPLHILTKIGLINYVVSDHMEAMNDTTPYLSTLPSPTLQPIGPIQEP